MRSEDLIVGANYVYHPNPDVGLVRVVHRGSHGYQSGVDINMVYLFDIEGVEHIGNPFTLTDDEVINKVHRLLWPSDFMGGNGLGRRVVDCDTLKINNLYELRSTISIDKYFMGRLVDLKDCYGRSITCKEGVVSKIIFEGLENRDNKEVTAGYIFAETPLYYLFELDLDKRIHNGDLEKDIEPLKKCKKPFKKILKLSEQDILKFLDEQGYNTEGYRLGDFMILGQSFSFSDVHITLDLLEYER